MYIRDKSPESITHSINKIHPTKLIHVQKITRPKYYNNESIESWKFGAKVFIGARILHEIVKTMYSNKSQIFQYFGKMKQFFFRIFLSLFARSFDHCTLYLPEVHVPLLSTLYLSYIATRRLLACMLAAYLLRNGWTDLAILFFVSSVLVTR